MASVQVKKLGFLVLLLVAAAFVVVGGTAEEQLEWCDYVVDVDILAESESIVKFGVSNSNVQGDSWSVIKKVRDDPPPPPASTGIIGVYQFVSKNLCKDPCHLTVQVQDGGVVPVSVRIRGYPSKEQNPEEKYDRVFLTGVVVSDINHC